MSLLVPPSAHARVAALCGLAARLTAGTPLRGQVTAIEDRLRGPLRVAIAGRVKAGKSTLLNALVGERLAPTDAGECTRLVTVYREGLGYAVRALLRNGRIEPLAFRRDGALEIELGRLTVGEIDRLDVAWPSSTLREITLIDTPGLASIDDANSARTQEFLALGENRSSEADAVIYLMRHLHRSDAEFLDAFLDRSVADVSPVNSVAVLSRADEIGAARLDAMDSAGRIAERYRRDDQLRPLCATVVALAGLIAETGATLRESEFAALRRLAGIPVEERDRLLLSADRFLGPEGAAVPVEERQALLVRFGVFGVRLAITEIAAGRVASAPELASFLVRTSGIDDLRWILQSHFLARARVLQARAALSALRKLARALSALGLDGGTRLAAEVERVEASAHEFAELRLAHLVMTGSLRLSPEEEDEIRRLTTPERRLAEKLGLSPDAPTSVIEATALAGIERWRIRAEDPLADPLLAEAAGIAARTYEGIYVAVRGSPVAPSA